MLFFSHQWLPGPSYNEWGLSAGWEPRQNAFMSSGSPYIETLVVCPAWADSHFNAQFYMCLNNYSIYKVMLCFSLVFVLWWAPHWWKCADRDCWCGTMARPSDLHSPYFLSCSNWGKIYIAQNLPTEPLASVQFSGINQIHNGMWSSLLTISQSFDHPE